MDKLPEGRFKRALVVTLAIAAIAQPLTDIVIQVIRLAKEILEIMGTA